MALITITKRVRLQNTLKAWDSRMDVEETNYIIDKYYASMKGHSLAYQIRALKAYATIEIL